MGAAAGEFGLVGSRASGFVEPRPDWSLEEQVAFLLRQDERAQARFDKLETVVAEQPAAWRQDIAEVRGELEVFVLEQVERERDMHIRVRLVGVGFLLVGVLLLAVANVV